MRRRFLSNKETGEKLEPLTIIPRGSSVTLQIQPSYATDDDGYSEYLEVFLYTNDELKKIIYETGTVTITEPTQLRCSLRYWYEEYLPDNFDLDYTVVEGLYIYATKGEFSVSGTIMSLYNSSDYEDMTLPENIPTDTPLRFGAGLVEILTPKTFAPSTELTPYCYQNLFYKCTKLINAPELPAKDLPDYCYAYMFNGCTSLSTVPDLTFNSVGVQSCINMFADCTSLVYGPDITLHTIGIGGFYGMFKGCTSLRRGPKSLAPTDLADSCFYQMFYKCSSLAVAPQLPTPYLAPYCYYAMFNQCSSLTEAPELPATTLKNACYVQMFFSCSSIRYIKALFTTTPNTNYTGNWVSGVAGNGTFVKNKNATWNVRGVYGIPTGWTVTTE